MKQYFETAECALRSRVVTWLNERGIPVTTANVDAILAASNAALALDKLQHKTEGASVYGS